MNPIQKYFQDLFAKKRVIGGDSTLSGLDKADLLLNDLVDEKRVPGLSITVLKEGTFLQKGYGYADLEKKTPVDATKTIFRIASVSKPIAATALAQMVADGLIDLDASFYDYVPYYPKKKWDFTIRQLASHTAGVRGYQGVEYGLNESYTIKEGIEIFKDDDLIFEPGRGYLYNSYDWVLISLAMQEASGIPFEEYVRQKVLSPLEMTNTYAECHPEPACRTKFYSKNRQGFRPAKPVNNFYKLAGGGYLSTSEDIAKLGQAYLDGKILKKEILSQFLTSEIVNGKPTHYGLGWQVGKDAQVRPFYGHVGNGVGGYSNFFVYPEERMVFAILMNCTNPDVQTELDLVIDFLLKPRNL
jgi:CubicO group peptidase (beta-lactamase class C family)